MDHSIDQHITEADALMVQLERDPLMRSTIVSVALLDRAPQWATVVDRVDRATRLVPAMRQKLVPSPLRLAPPHWVFDSGFDLAHHVRRFRLPDGGGLGEVMEWAETTATAAFDPERPLWELTLFEGLDEDRAATVLKMHHVLMDGVGGLAVLLHVLDTQREPAIPTGASPVVPARSAPNAFETLVDLARYDTARAVRTGSGLLRILPRGIGRSVLDPAGATREVVATAADFVRLFRPALTTRSPVMTDRRLGSHFEVLEVPLPQLKRAAKAAGGTLNDAFVAAIVGGLRIYHDKHSAPVERLRMVMTINVRGQHDAVGGNHVTGVRAEVPVATTDTLQRVREITDLCHRMRKDRSIPHLNAVAGILNALPVAVMAGMLKHDDFVASNVPGYPEPLYLGGARLDAFYGFGPTAGTAVNVTLLSYRDTCHIGINANAGAVSDPELLRECLREGAAEVLSLADLRI